MKIELDDSERAKLVELVERAIEDFEWCDGEEEAAGKHLLNLQALVTKLEGKPYGAPTCVFEDCDQSPVADSCYCAGHLEQERTFREG